MRKITAGMFITLDGIIEAPVKWNPPDQVALQLPESRAHGNGVVALRYGRPVMAQ